MWAGLMVLFTVAAVALIVSFGIIIPKRLAAKEPEKWGYRMMPMVLFVAALLLPLTKLISAMAWLVLKAFGVDMTAADENVTEEDIMSMVNEGHEQGERRRAQQALNQAKGRLRSLVGSKAGLRLTPQLEFIFDEVPGEAHEIEDILAIARKRDEELAKARETAQYAGDADPYKHDEPDDDDDFDEDDDIEVEDWDDDDEKA